MTAKRDPLVYLDDILESVNRILQYTKDKTEIELDGDQTLQDAVLLRFEIIGEAARQMPEEFRKEHPEIPWRDMVEMRNKILHEYFGWNWHIIWKTITEDLPLLKEQVEKLTKE